MKNFMAGFFLFSNECQFPRNHLLKNIPQTQRPYSQSGIISLILRPVKLHK